MPNGNIIRGSSINIEYPDAWAEIAERVIPVAQKWLDPEFQNKLKIQGEEQNRYNAQQGQLIFKRNYDIAVAKLTRDRGHFKMAYEETEDNPVAQSAIVDKFSKDFVNIPQPDGTTVREFIVSPVMSGMTTTKKKNYNDFDDIRDRWEGAEGVERLTRAERILIAPRYIRLGQDLGNDMSEAKALRDRDLKFNENRDVLDAWLGMASLPPKYDGTRLRNLLLKDDEVSEGELEVAAKDISYAIGEREAASAFWQDFLNNATKALGDTGLDTDPGVVKKLSDMQNIALKNLTTYFPKIGVPSDIVDIFDKEADSLAKEIYGMSYEELNDSQKSEIQNEANRRVGDPFGMVPEIEPEEEKIKVARTFPILGQKYKTPEEEGFPSKASYLEDVWSKSQAGELNLGKGFVKDYFGNDKEKFLKWWSGPRTMGALPVKTPRLTDKPTSWKPRGLKKTFEKLREEDIPMFEAFFEGAPYPLDELKESGRTIDPLNRKIIDKKDLIKKYNNNKLAFANDGIILKDAWPYWERVTVKEALQSIRK